MEECVSDFGCRDEIEDYIFDTKRSWYPFFEKKEEEEPQRKRRRSSAFNLQDYTLLRRKRDKKKYIQKIREEYLVLDEKCKREASRVMQFSDYLNIRSTKLDIPRYRLKLATLISRLSSLIRIHPQISMYRIKRSVVQLSPRFNYVCDGTNAVKRAGDPD
ncbi:uncharacterized protein LOC113360833 isoform X1 [Papaver somniferum]|uniref:uncharacterized protein LOC113360833 isoform X1 n=1 Tax=Papaver somniferum TaxID=3469 RepID=UPI000E6F7162|nr:uncharacterized protein LOC113360833 isoform X1 [Papaver somniferum]